jgi:hypothetical protein
MSSEAVKKARRERMELYGLGDLPIDEREIAKDFVIKIEGLSVLDHDYGSEYVWICGGTVDKLEMFLVSYAIIQSTVFLLTSDR